MKKNEKSHGSVIKLSHGTCNERSSILQQKKVLQQGHLHNYN